MGPIYPGPACRGEWPRWMHQRVHVLELFRGDVGPFVVEMDRWAPMREFAERVAQCLGVRPRDFDLYCGGKLLPTDAEELGAAVAEGATVIVQLKRP